MTQTCYCCGRVGQRGFDPLLDQVRCANRDACEQRQADTSPASKLRQIRGLVNRVEYQSGAASFLARRIQKVLDA